MSLSDLDFRNMFAEVATQTSESKVSVKISTDASSKMTTEFTSRFLQAANLPDNTAIGALSKRQRFAYIVGLALFVKEQGYSNTIVEQVLCRVTSIPKGKFTSIMGKAKTLFILRKCRECELRVDRMTKRQSGAIKALNDGKVVTEYKRGGTAHWPTILDIDGCAAATAYIMNVKETLGPPKYDADGKITNWTEAVQKKVEDAIVIRRNAEQTFLETGKLVKAEVSKVFGVRGSRSEWDVVLDPVLCVASTYHHEDTEMDEDDDTEE